MTALDEVEAPAEPLLASDSVLLRLGASFFRLLGIDLPVFYALVGRSLSVATMPVTLYLLVRNMSATEQGYYYTFNNVSGLTVFFELGLGFVVTQFASHEKALLTWSPAGTLVGDDRAKRRLAALVRKALSWYSIATLLIFAVILPAGFIFFRAHDGADHVAWRAPWLWMVVSAGTWCWISPWFAILTGCGLVAKMQRNGVIQQTGMQVVLWTVLLAHGGLYALPLSALFGTLFVLAWLLATKRGFVRDLWHVPVAADDLSWRHEIWPMQWKIAASWMSGYLLTQLFSPILFRFHGAEIAGRMGMTLTLANALSATSIAWISTKSPVFGSLIAKHDYVGLDRLFFRSLWQSTGVLAAGAVVVLSVLAFLARIHHPFSARVLPTPLAALLLLTALATHVANAQALYLRAHKREPLLVVSIGSAIAITACIVVFGRSGAGSMIIGYFACTVLVNLGWTTVVFQKKRSEWHRIDSEMSGALS